MSKTTKTWLIFAFSLIITGCLIFLGIMNMLKWDFSKLSTSKYQDKEYTITEEFSSISVNTTTADISFIPSNDEKTTVICHEKINMPHSVKEDNGELKIEVIDNRAWYEHIGINFGKPQITVVLPASTYGDLKINCTTGDVNIAKDFNFNNIQILLTTGDVFNSASSSESMKIKITTGDICINNLSTLLLGLKVTTGKINLKNVNVNENVEITVTTGETNLTNVNCKNLTSTGTTGKIHLENVVASEKILLSRTTGDVIFDGIDASEIKITSTTGDVKGSVNSEKVFMVHTRTGKKQVPSTIAGGKCEIFTTTGDIIITIK